MATSAQTSTSARVSTPWGNATVVEQAVVSQRVGEKRFATVIELLAAETGEQLVRIAYSTGGAVRRGPVTLRARDLDRLRRALGDHPQLASMLGLGGA